MKKLSLEQYLWSKKTNRAHWLRRLKQEQKAREKRVSESTYGKNTPTKNDQPLKQIFGYEIIKAPVSLSIFEESNAREFFEFISVIKLECLKKKRKIMLDIADTLECKVSALIVLYANLHAIQLQLGLTNIIRINASKKKETNSIFREIGLLSLCHNGKQALERQVLTATTGSAEASTDSQPQIRACIEYVYKALNESSFDDDLNETMYGAVTESILNVGNHAYEQPDTTLSQLINDVGKRWWFITHKIEDQLFIAIYDMGESIPKTLPRQPFYQQLLTILNAFITGSIDTDSNMIKGAMEYGKSRHHDQQKRGKGLFDIKSFVEANPMGELFVYSRYGRYSYQTQDRQEIVKDSSCELQGTLIQWNIHLAPHGTA